MTTVEGAKAEQPEQIGPYRLGPIIGSGGMGRVYRAWDERLERAVAIKRVHQAGREVSRVRERFRREAKAVAKLNHPAIVQVYDLVEHGDEDWLVMELVEGHSLTHLLARGELGLDDILLLAREIVAGLAAAHQRGVVHRDLKSENVLVSSDGHAKILDFGLAKQLDAEVSALTAEGVAIGTLRAMAPEQINGEEADARTDLYALGVLLYEALAGANPFLSGSHVSTLKAVLMSRPEPLALKVDGVPAELSRLVDRLLAKERDQRPRDALEVGAELEQIAAGRPTTRPLQLSMLPSGAASRPVALPETEAMPRARAGVAVATEPVVATARSRSRGSLAAVATVLGLGCLGLGSWWVLRPEPIPPVARQIAVLRPEVFGAEAGPARLLAVALREALLSGVGTREGLSAPAPEVVDPIDGGPLEIARALAASEVLSSRADCSGEICEVQLRRIGSDGSTLWSKGFPVPLRDLAVVPTAVATHLAQGFADYEMRGNVQRRVVSPEAYSRYLDIAAAHELREGGVTREELLQELATLRREAPELIEGALLASRVHRLRFVEEGRAEDREAAIEFAERARVLDPSDPRAAEAAFEALLAAGDIDRAEQALGLLQQAEPGDPRLLSLRAGLASSRGEAAQALALARLAVERLPSWDLLFRAANLEYQQGHPTEARVHLEKLLDRFPGHYDGLSLLAQIETVSGSLDRAVELYEQLVERSRGVAELSNLGVVLMLSGRFDESCDRFEEALGLAPANATVILNLADCRALGGATIEAERRYREVLGLVEAGETGAGLTSLLLQAQAAAHLEDSAAAVKAINDALRSFPDSVETSYVAGLVFAVLGERASAMHHVREARARGLEPRWFSLPWFETIRSHPEMADLQLEHDPG